MIAKATIGTDFKPLLRYLLDEDKLPEIVNKNDLAIVNPTSITSIDDQLTAITSLNSKVEKPVWHFSLSFSPKDSNKIDEELIQNVVKEFSERIGISENQFLAVKHNDTKHPHLHIVANRVNSTGRCLADNMVKKRAMEAGKQIEEMFGLTIASKEYKSLYNKKRLLDYTSTFIPQRNHLQRDIQNIIRKETEKSYNTENLVKRLDEKYGIKIHKEGINKDKTENIPVKSIEELTDKKTKISFTYTYLNNKNGEIITKNETENIDYIRINTEEIKEKTENNKENITTNYNKYTDIINKHFKEYTKDPTKYNMKKYITQVILRTENSAFIEEEIVKKGKNKEQKEAFQDMIDNLMIQQFEMKQKLMKQETNLIPQNQRLPAFNFTKLDKEIIDSSQIKNHYKLVLDSLKIRSTIIRNLITLKKINSDTIFYYHSQMSGDKVNSENYDPSKVNHIDANILFAFSKRQDLQSRTNIDMQMLGNSVRAYKYNSDIEDTKPQEKNIEEITIFLAKRGFKLFKDKNNIFITNASDEKIQLAVHSGLDQFKKRTLINQNVENEKLEKIFNQHYNKNKSEVYRKIDSQDIKGISNYLIANNIRFKLDKFDEKLMNENLINIVKNALKFPDKIGKMSKAQKI